MIIIPYHGYQVEIKWNLSFADWTFVIPCSQPLTDATEALDAYLVMTQERGSDQIVGKRNRTGGYVMKVRHWLHNSWARQYIAHFNVEDGVVVLRCTARLPRLVKWLSRLYSSIFVLSAVAIPVCAALDGGKAMGLAVVGPWFFIALWAGIISLGNSFAATDTEYIKDTLSWLMGSSNAAIHRNI